MFNPNFTADLSKMFDPQAIAKNMQQWCDFNTAVKTANRITNL